MRPFPGGSEGLRVLALLALAAPLTVTGCEDREAVQESPVAEQPVDTASAPTDPQVRTEPLDSVRVLRAWLVNRRSTPVMVDARAGADPVDVDSLGPLDSTRVNLEVRSDSVRLTVRAPDGRELGVSWLYVSEDSVTRFELP